MLPETIRLRRDFLAANKARRVVTPGFILLVNQRRDDDEKIRAGYTVTKKIGGAVVRNRMKRRLRALAREFFPAQGFPGADGGQGQGQPAGDHVTDVDYEEVDGK